MKQEEEIRKLNNLIRSIDFQISDLDDEIKKVQRQKSVLELELRMKTKEFQQIKMDLDGIRLKEKGIEQDLFIREDEKTKLKKKRNELFGQMQNIKEN